MTQRAALEHPSQPMNIPSPRGVLGRDSRFPLDAENSMGNSQNIFESLPAREGPSSALFENSKNLASSSCGLGSGNTMEHRKGVRPDPQSSSMPTPRCNQSLGTLNPFVSYRRNMFSKWCDGLPEISDLGTASWKIPGHIGVSKLESQLQG